MVTPTGHALWAYGLALKLYAIASGISRHIGNFLSDRIYVSLLTPAVMLEVTMHVGSDGSRRVYMSKLTNPQMANMMVGHLIQTGLELANQWNIQVKINGGPQA